MAKVTMSYQGRMTIGEKVFNFLPNKEFECTAEESKIFQAEIDRRNQLVHRKREIEKRKKEEALARGE